MFTITRLRMVHIRRTTPIVTNITTRQIRTIRGRLNLISRLHVNLLRRVVTRRHASKGKSASNTSNRRRSSTNSRFHTRQGHLGSTNRATPCLILLQRQPKELRKNQGNQEVKNITHKQQVKVLTRN